MQTAPRPMEVSASAPSIFVVVVLYRIALEDSPTWQGLRACLEADPTLATRIQLLVADNSPASQAPPAGFPGEYLHDGANPGLARRYNQGLERAQAIGATWLLLFDQDTNPTPAYMKEIGAQAEALAGTPQVAVLAPKLIMGGRILSPHAPRYRAGTKIVANSRGTWNELLRVFNSGAAVRVSALVAAGGFPEAYWLDYLDHATFHRIQQQGGRVFLLDAALEHELSDARPNTPQDPVRLANRLTAEERFYTEHGSFSEHLQHRFDLLRQVIGWGRRGHFIQAIVRLKVLLHL